MKSADSYTIHTLGVPSLVLMERAALAVVQNMKERKTDISKPLIVCGSGNNGGDGFAIARLIQEEGWMPEVLFAGRESSLSEECAVQKKIVENMGIPVVTEIPEKEYTVIIDAVFGVGLSREISGRYAEIIRWMNEQNCAKTAVDIPSGICSETGRVLGIAFRADLTVSMACVKIGCELYPGKEYAGETVAAPIGISTDIFKEDPSVCMTYDREDLPVLLPRRKANSHKGSYGKVLMITGSSGMAGAAYLSAGLPMQWAQVWCRSILRRITGPCFSSCSLKRSYPVTRSMRKSGWITSYMGGCRLHRVRNGTEPSFGTAVGPYNGEGERALCDRCRRAEPACRTYGSARTSGDPGNSDPAYA